MAFRLLRLLNLYQRQEEHCMLVYQERLTKQQQAEVHVHQLEDELFAASHSVGAVDGEALQKHWAFRRFLGDQLTEARAALHAAQEEAEQARAELLTARQQRKTLEALKEKYDARMRLEQAHKEQVILDEAGLRSHKAGL